MIGGASLIFTGEWKLRDGCRAKVVGLFSESNTWIGYSQHAKDGPRLFEEWDIEGRNLSGNTNFDLMRRRVGEEQW